MSVEPSTWDAVIVGAGPAGLATAYHATEAGLSTVVLDRGCVAENIRRYPANLIFYSTPDLIELGDLPLVTSSPKPNRTEAVMYYTRFAKAKGIDVRTYQNVVKAKAVGREFELLAKSHVGVETTYRAKAVVLAFGAYDVPNLLGVPGEELPHVSHYYDEPERYHARDVLIVGGKGSASEAALQIWRAGGRVTMSYRRPEFRGLKYWIEPDLVNRIKEGSIKAFLPSTVKEIRLTETVLELADGTLETVPADFVLALTGYQPKLDLFDQLGISYDPLSRRPRIDKRTHESNVPGVYVAGCICAGNIGNEIFIENGRLHGAEIVKDLVRE